MRTLARAHYKILGRFKDKGFLRRILLKWKISLEFPLTLNIETTNACNLHCAMCPRERSGRKMGYMNFPLFRKIIDESCEHGKRAMITLHKDGEPLLHPELLRMIKYVKEADAAHEVSFNTNGYFLDEKMSIALMESGLDDFVVSIDAVTNETYLRLKGISGLDKVQANVIQFLCLRRKLGFTKPYLRVQMIGDMRETAPELEKFKHRWEGVADEVKIDRFTTWGGAVQNMREKQIPQSTLRYPCEFLWYTLAINWDGSVSMCVYDSKCQGIVGDMNRESLAEIWRGEKFRKIRLAHLNGTYYQIPPCIKCDAWLKTDDIGDWLRRKHLY